MTKENCIIHFLPARAGDCFVLEFDDKNCILIDSGYQVTYREELKPLLQKLAEKGCKIVLMIITHIDEDHILGAISFLEDNGNADHPQIIQVDEIWHNGIFNTIMNSERFLRRKTENVPEKTVKEYKTICGILKAQLPGEAGLISAPQSKTFEEVCAKYHYKVNRGFDRRCVVKSKSCCFGNCEVQVLSPGMTELEKLGKILDRELIRTFGKDYLWKRTEEFGELLELITLYQGADAPGNFTMRQISAGTGDIQKWLGTSNLAEMNEINCASIVVVIRYKGLKFLFMGDSESELWKEQLEPKYDLIKVSHHGSTKPNLAWMESTKARKLLISTNGGRHRHPEDEFLARVMMGDFEELYFNYDIQRKSAILAMQEKYHFRAEFQKREIVLDCVTGEG